MRIAASGARCPGACVGDEPAPGDMRSRNAMARLSTRRAIGTNGRFSWLACGKGMQRGSAAASPLPGDEAAPRGREDDDAERDPVPRERNERVRRDIAQQPAHAEPSEHEREAEADEKE